MADDGVTFTEAAARRLVDAARRTERQPPPPAGRSTGTSDGPTRFLARLTAESAGAWKWEAVSLTAAGAYEAIAGVSSGADYTAKEYNGKSATAQDVVWLDFWGYASDGKPQYRFSIGGSASVYWGTLTADWTPGSETVTLQPVADATGTAFDPVPATIAARIIMPIGKAPAYLLGDVDDLFAYEDIGGIYLLKSPQTTPIPAAAYEVIQAAAAGEWAADYLRGNDVP